MTTATPEASAQTQVEETAKPSVDQRLNDLWENGQDMSAVAILRLAWEARQEFDKATAKYGELNRSALSIDAILNDTDDSVLTELKSDRAALLNQLTNYENAIVERARELGKANVVTDEEKTKAKAEVAKHRQKMNAALDLIAKMDSEDFSPEVKTLIGEITPQSAATSTSSGGNTSQADNESAKIRAWASTQGLHVNPRGRIPETITKLYKAAMAREEVAAQQN